MKYLMHIFLSISLTAQANVIEVNGQAELDAKLKEHPNAVLKFYRPGCPHCETIKNDYARIAQKIPTVAFLAINTAQPANRPVFPKWGVRGVPMIFFIKNGAKTEYKRSQNFAATFEPSVRSYFEK